MYQVKFVFRSQFNRRFKLARLVSAVAALAALPAAALAQTAPYPYVGLSAGRSHSQFDEQQLAARLLGAGRTITSLSRDDKDTAYKIFGGYQMSRNFGLELGYFDLGKSSFNASTLPVGSLAGEIAVQGVNLDLVATLPLSERWAASARLGAQYARTRTYASGAGSIIVTDPEGRRREGNAKVGLGLQYAFSPNFIMRAEAERYRVSDGHTGGRGNINVASLSLVFPFGRAPEPAPRVAAVAYVAPAYVAPPAPMVAQLPPPPVMTPAPAPAPVVVAPTSRRVSFSAETLFGFDQSVIRPEGRATLDNFTKELAGTRFDAIVVEGHTDRLGSDAYNLALSTRRAAAVKSYLVESGRLDAATISTMGKGESQPVTKAGDCKGTRANAQLIQCLQPDRRVDVVMTGMR